MRVQTICYVWMGCGALLSLWGLVHTIATLTKCRSPDAMLRATTQMIWWYYVSSAAIGALDLATLPLFISGDVVKLTVAFELLAVRNFVAIAYGFLVSWTTIAQGFAFASKDIPGVRRAITFLVVVRGVSILVLIALGLAYNSSFFARLDALLQASHLLALTLFLMFGTLMLYLEATRLDKKVIHLRDHKSIPLTVQLRPHILVCCVLAVCCSFGTVVLFAVMKTLPNDGTFLRDPQSFMSTGAAFVLASYAIVYTSFFAGIRHKWVPIEICQRRVEAVAVRASRPAGRTSVRPTVTARPAVAPTRPAGKTVVEL